MQSAILVYITAGSVQEAERIAEALLAARAVACVNRVYGVHSAYWWQGQREAAEECLLLAKTRQELWPEVLRIVREHHSYEVFEAIAVPIIEGSPEYLAWIAESTQSQA